jgi:hypothetical protein
LPETGIFDQRLAIRAHLTRHLAREFDPFLRFTEPPDASALVAEQEFRNIPAAVLLANSQ